MSSRLRDYYHYFNSSLQIALKLLLQNEKNLLSPIYFSKIIGQQFFFKAIQWFKNPITQLTVAYELMYSTSEEMRTKSVQHNSHPTPPNSILGIRIATDCLCIILWKYYDLMQP